MCGIFGCNQLNDSTRGLMTMLAWKMKERGTDSWGGSNGIDRLRYTGSILDSWGIPSEWERGIFHTRAATHGSAHTVENAHPFQFTSTVDGSEIIGIHNGMIRNHTILGTKYGRSFGVDSMHIFANIAEGKPLEELEGYMALAWFEGPQRDLWFLRHSTVDLHIVTLEGGEVVFCSNITPIREAAKLIQNPIKTEWEIKENRKYRLVPGGVEEGEVVPFHSTSGTSYNFGRTGLDSRHESYTPSFPVRYDKQHWKKGEFCYGCRVVKVTEQELFCMGCFDDKVKRFKAATFHQD